MTMYASLNTKTKKELKEAVQSGKEVRVNEMTPWGSKPVLEGKVYLSGPHYPQPHKWYAQGEVRDGKLISLK